LVATPPIIMKMRPRSCGTGGKGKRNEEQEKETGGEAHWTYGKQNVDGHQSDAEKFGKAAETL
jgi:hypothetical protein